MLLLLVAVRMNLFLKPDFLMEAQADCQFTTRVRCLFMNKSNQTFVGICKQSLRITLQQERVVRLFVYQEVK